MDAEHEKRFVGMEARLARLEALLAAMATGRPQHARPQPAPPVPPSDAPREALCDDYALRDDERPRERKPALHDETRPALATSILGWGGALALVLAAAYLIRLAIDTGWLTPVRQVGLAAIAGLALIAAGPTTRAAA